MSRTLVLVVVAALLSETWGVPLSSGSSPRAPNHFPDGFYLGAATAAYQIEGGWNEDGKGESIWDHTLHAQPNLTSDGQNGDVAADSYHKYKEDVKLLVGLNANVYRFSLSWPRILPTGDTDNINQAGIDYYNNLINELLANGIQPMVTLYHWDLPQELQKLGGWPNAVIADYFVEFARIAFENFGDRVSRVGITLNIDWYEPVTSSADDAEASDRQLQFECGLWAHPIFSREGDFPEVVKLRVAANSRKEGRTRSRLPTLSPAEVNLIRGTADFFGINHYSFSLATSGSSGSEPSKTYDSGVVTSVFDGYPNSFWISDIPWGLRKLLNWLHKSYPGYPFFITENGWSDPPGVLNDTARIHYYRGYLSALLRSINDDGVPVIGYTAWSLLDNLEWMSGYTIKFGLYSVDYDGPERPRTAKASVPVMAQIYKEKAVPLEDFENADTTPPS
ncbi:myrosinase 1-like [Schistocerca piceifrons]|uniref:myrosinase 1-like n=1 Tax=Schistocerca piceifrons TaxID=274613 RepID=UPI001F5E5609|nr:myrosinase 1-like [Schistocerca piceifrons]